ncbi:MAG TPA: hypothetical protein VFF79_12865 [Conexibacter sp.]|nr:hypothetical protein [Conexibacter sp.]
MPQLLRGDEEDERDLEEGTDDETAEGKKPTKAKAAREAEPVQLKLLTRLREMRVEKTGERTYEVTIIREGLGNPTDGNYYTREALQKAVSDGMFEGLKAYANHPTQDEERQRPERDVRQLVGHYREARYLEDAGVGQVRATFVPIAGAGYEWVVSLVEAAISAGSSTDRPLAGISIDGGGVVDPGQLPDGRHVNFVREVRHLPSADLVTSPGAGGVFLRRLTESKRQLNPATRPGHHNASKEVRMKPAEMQEKIKAAQAKFREATREGADESGAETTLREAVSIIDEVATAEIEVELREVEKIVEKPVAASDDEKDQLATKLREAETARDAAIGERDEARTERDEAKGKLTATERAITAGRVLREAEVPKELAELWFDDVVKCDDETAMRRLLERKTKEREITIAHVREAFTGVEGFAARVPAGEGDAKARLVAAGLPVKAEEE